MVPASVLVRREAAGKGSMSGAAGLDDEISIGPGFGLAPMQKSASGRGQRGQQLQPPQMGRWGNAVSVTTVSAGAGAGAGGGGSKQAGGKGGAGGGAPKVDAKLEDFMASLKDLGAFE